MIIIKKKNTFILLGIILVIIFAAILFLNSEEEKTVQTVALPVSGKVIILDAGHGGEDGRSNDR